MYFHSVTLAEGSPLYAGPFDSPRPDLEERPDLYRPFDKDAESFWRTDKPESVLRPVLESALFGRWNYPIGVTLYGLTRAAEYMGREDILQYVNRHIGECARLYRYSLWDKARYEYPEVNIQLANISMLDDCGSFGNALLEAEAKIPGLRTEGIAEDIARYMRTGQERREDGAFYRICEGTFMENTLWADDLYMSVPFLCRYFRKTGDVSYLDDAVNQLRQFKRYLHMEELNLMSHVYDFKYETQTRIPWGRGNGWVFFSLAETLSFLPEGYGEKDFLLDFYGELAEGYMGVQTQDGMWHQVLTDPLSYPEASCTAMFVYGLAMGARSGWLGEREEAAAHAANRGWEGLTRTCVDCRGNVYGISGGSDYSFTEEYYSEKLSWVKNDPHGIGVILLAGIEICRLRDKRG